MKLTPRSVTQLDTDRPVSFTCSYQSDVLLRLEIRENPQILTDDALISNQIPTYDYSGSETVNIRVRPELKQVICTLYDNRGEEVAQAVSKVNIHKKGTHNDNNCSQNFELHYENFPII